MKKHLFLLLFPAILFAGIAEKPLAKAGFVSDTHVTPYRKSCIPLEKALRLFKAHKVDLLDSGIQSPALPPHLQCDDSISNSGGN